MKIRAPEMFCSYVGFLTGKRAGQTSGFDILHDVCVLLASLVAIRIDEEGERYITISAVVPRLLSAKAKIDTMFILLKKGEGNEFGFRNRQQVMSWRVLFDRLWAAYMQPFYMDEVCLVSSTLDPRFGTNSMPSDMARRACTYLRMRLQREFEAREREREQHAADVLLASVAHSPVTDGVNAGEKVADPRKSDVEFYDHDIQVSDAGWAQAEVVLMPRTYNKVSDELAELARLMRLRTWTMASDPMKLYQEKSLTIVKPIACGLLAVLAGEAPSERIFSMALAALRPNRARMTADTLVHQVTLDKNELALSDIY